VPAGAHRSLAELGPQWAVSAPHPWTVQELVANFDRSALRLLDIGCGNGVATRAWALEHPDHDVVAVELHRPGLVRLLRDLDDAGPANVRVMELDALTVLEGAEPGTFAQVRVLFPDPWPKRRHRERRMVDGTFLARIAELLPIGGQLHVATDWDDYADQIRSAIGAEPRFQAVAKWPSSDRSVLAWASSRPERPVTAYEQRAIDAGRAVTDLVARRVDVALPTLGEASPG
jgi:tRNA (guanine-N7-)-methyltransferase